MTDRPAAIDYEDQATVEDSSDKVFDRFELFDNEYDRENNITYQDLIDIIKQIEPEELEDAFYDQDEVRYIEPAGFADHLQEALTQAQRIRKANAMRRSKAKIAYKRKLAMKKKATFEVLQKRAHKMAIKILKKRLAKKDVEDMSYNERQRVEDLVKKRPELVKRIQMKMLPVVRALDQQRHK